MGPVTQYVGWGFIVIAVPNLIVIGLLVAVFVIAVLVRFHHDPTTSTLDPSTDAGTTEWEALL